jgi:hypothetical protein
LSAAFLHSSDSSAVAAVPHDEDESLDELEAVEGEEAEAEADAEVEEEE